MPVPPSDAALLFYGDPLLHKMNDSCWACLCCKKLLANEGALEAHVSSAEHREVVAYYLDMGKITERRGGLARLRWIYTRMASSFSSGAALGSWFSGRHSQLCHIWSLSPHTSSVANGENGLYGGQLQPCVVFVATLAAVWVSDSAADCAAPPHVDGRSAAIWGIFVRLVAVAYGIAFASLLPQMLGLVGSRGLYPAADLLAQVRQDMPSTLPRCACFPAGWLWWSASDAALRGTCSAGMACAAVAAYGGVGSARFGMWTCWIVLMTTVPYMHYPWDGLLSEIGFAVTTLLPPAAPLHEGVGLAGAALPSWHATWTLRVMLVRLLFGMGKLKFSQGWAHHSNSLYLKSFMTWQTQPTPFAWHLVARIPDAAWRALHASMWLLEVPLPAAHLSGTYALRGASALLTIALQLGIHLSGNYGLFNILTALLALPLLAEDSCDEASTDAASGVQRALAALLAVLAALELPHNSYTTNTWPYLVPTPELPAPLRRAAIAILGAVRALKPFHLVHGYGVFTPRGLRGLDQVRVVLRVYARFDEPAADASPHAGASDGGSGDGGDSGDSGGGDDGGGRWWPIPTRYNSAAGGGRLQFFAPHQPRLDQQLFFEGVGLHIAQGVTLINPYVAFSDGALPRLAQRILEGESSVIALLAPDALPEGRRVAALAFRREWVRFSTRGERRESGAWLVDVPPEQRCWMAAEVEVERFRREDVARDGTSSAVHVRSLTELPLGQSGSWVERAREMRAQRASKHE